MVTVILKTVSRLLLLLSIISLPAIGPAKASSIAEYTKAIEQSPPAYKYKFYLYRGQAYIKENQPAKGIKDLNASIRLNPTIKAHRTRGILLYENGQYKAAINDFDQYLKRKDDIDIYRKRSFAGFTEKFYKKAMADARKVLAVRPNDKLCQKILMECETAIQNPPERIVINSAPPPRIRSARNTVKKKTRRVTKRRKTVVKKLPTRVITKTKS